MFIVYIASYYTEYKRKKNYVINTKEREKEGDGLLIVCVLFIKNVRKEDI